MDRTRRHNEWCTEFAVLYEATARCTPDHARFIAVMLGPSLDALSPAEAVSLLLASEGVPDDIQRRFHDGRASA
jgi:hypothetical protein